MKQKKTLFMAIIALLLIIFNVNFVNAAEGSASIEIVPDVQNAKKEQTVTFTVYLTDIVSELGMGGLQGALKFNEEFDADTVTVKGLNGMSATYNKTNNYVVAYKDDLTSLDNLIKNRTAIMEVSVKVKEGATIGNKATMAIIPQDSGDGQADKLYVAEAYNGDDGVVETRPIGTSPATASVTVSEEGGIIVVPSTPSAKPSTKPSTKPTAVNSPKVTTPPSKLPQTGINDNPVPVLFGALVVVLISYIAYRRYKEV